VQVLQCLESSAEVLEVACIPQHFVSAFQRRGLLSADFILSACNAEWDEESASSFREGRLSAVERALVDQFIANNLAAELDKSATWLRMLRRELGMTGWMATKLICFTGLCIDMMQGV
jgi:hypothetical protein